LLCKLVGDGAELLMVAEANREQLSKQARQADKNQILQLLRITMDTGEKLRFSEGHRFLLELAFLEMIAVFAGMESKAAEPVIAKKQSTAPVKEKIGRNDAREILWNRILAGVKEKKIPTHALLSQGKLLGTKGEIMYIGYRKGYKFHKDRMEEKANRDILDQVIKEVFNREMEVQFLFLDEQQVNDMVVKKAIEYFGEDIVDIKD